MHFVVWTNLQLISKQNGKCVDLWLPLVVCTGNSKQPLLTFCHIPLAGNRDPTQSHEAPWVPQCVPKNIKRKKWIENKTHTTKHTHWGLLREILTSVFPLKSCTGSSFPAEKAKVQRAHADLSSNPARSLYRPNNGHLTRLEMLASSLFLFRCKYLC